MVLRDGERCFRERKKDSAGGAPRRRTLERKKREIGRGASEVVCFLMAERKKKSFESERSAGAVGDRGHTTVKYGGKWVGRRLSRVGMQGEGHGVEAAFVFTKLGGIECIRADWGVGRGKKRNNRAKRGIN